MTNLDISGFLARIASGLKIMCVCVRACVREGLLLPLLQGLNFMAGLGSA